MLDKIPQQGSFWDTQWIEHLIDKESFEWHFLRIVRPLIKDEDFAWAYDPDRGRKAIPPSLVACALILQQRYQLSDREMERQIRFHLAAKYALGLPMDDPGFDHTVLCKFRRMLVEHDQTRICFDKFRGALVKAGLIKEGETAVIDTTHVIADIAIPNTIELIRMGMKAVLNVAGNSVVKNLDLGIVDEKSKRVKEKEFLVAVVLGAKRLIDYLEKSGDARHPRLRNPLDYLRRILCENTQERLEERGKEKRLVIEERQGPVANRLVSIVDPDARHGRKSKEKKFVGYKAQILESEQEFISAIEGMAGNRHDRFGVSEIIMEVAEAGIKPRQMVGDKAYGDEPLGVTLEDMSVRMVTPLKAERGDYFSNDRFEYLQKTSGLPTMRCPAGHETTISDYHPWKERYFHFTNCGSCVLKPQCTPAENRSVAVSSSFFFRHRKAAFNQTVLYKNLMSQRAKIERKNGQLKNQIGFRRCHYRGLAKFRFQCFFAAVAANIQRVITLVVNGPPLSEVQKVLYAV